MELRHVVGASDKVKDAMNGVKRENLDLAVRKLGEVLERYAHRHGRLLGTHERMQTLHRSANASLDFDRHDALAKLQDVIDLSLRIECSMRRLFGPF